MQGTKAGKLTLLRGGVTQSVTGRLRLGGHACCCSGGGDGRGKVKPTVATPQEREGTAPQ